MRKALFFCLAISFCPRPALAQAVPPECSKQHADPYYSGRVSRLIAHSLICEAIAPESVHSFQQVHALYRSEDPACWDATQAMLLDSPSFAEGIAGYVEHHNSGKRSAERVQQAVSECRDIEAADAEYRSYLRPARHGG